MRIAVPYILFAIIAVLANIGAQDVSIQLYRGASALPISIGIGTIVGLFVKYCLDRRYIFNFQPINAAHDSQTFLLYACMGYRPR